MGDLTKNFSRWEFACKCGCGFDDINEGLVHRLQVIRDITQVYMMINSGCRCPEHNKKKGGASVSYHLVGYAADWRFSEHCSSNLYFQTAVLLKDWSGGLHYYKDRSFFHADIGKERRW